MFRTIAAGIGIICLFLSGKAQEAFVIKSYHVEVNINFNGSFDISETIDADFTEPRHGLIRSIPYRYTVQQFSSGEAENREAGNSYYDTYIRNIEVEGAEFSTEYKGDYLQIKMGSSAKTVTGRQVYTIRYTVWGALNHFEEHTEFFWNLVGTEWSTPVEKVSFCINFPGPVKLMQQNIRIFTGEQGSTREISSFELGSNTLKSSEIIGLKPNQGVSVVIAFPKKYLSAAEVPIEIMADNFVIRNAYCRIKLNSDASLSVEETYVIDFRKPVPEFVRMIANHPQDNENPDAVYQNNCIQNIATSVSGPRATFIVTDSNVVGENKYIRFRCISGSMSGRYVFTLKYRVWGAYNFNHGFAILHWNMLPRSFGEPVEFFNFRIETDSSVKTNIHGFRFFENLTPRHFPRYYNRDHSATESKEDILLRKSADINLKVRIMASNIHSEAIPFQVYAKTHYIRKVVSSLTIEKNGIVKVSQKFNIVFHSPLPPNAIFKNRIYYLFPDDLGSYTGISFKVPDYSLVTGVTRAWVSDIRVNPSGYYMQPDWLRLKYDIEYLPEPLRTDSVYELEYRIFDILNKKGRNLELFFPLTPMLDEPVACGEFEIVFPNRPNVSPVTWEAWYGGKVATPAEIKLYLQGNKLRGTLPRGLYPGEVVVVRVLFPSAYLSGQHILLTIWSVWVNNFFLLLPVVFFVILLVLWILIGKDKKEAVVVNYHPPQDITPAEAGFLWDNRLQQRDLVSLFWYWAGKGNIKIREFFNESTSTTDYEIEHLKPLNNDARKFEKVIFARLFKTSGKVKLSTLRGTFYITMNRAGRELRQYIRFNNFYVPGTLGFSRMLKFFSYLIMLAGGIVLLNAEYSYAQIIISFSLMFVMMRVFAHLMPRRAHFGHEKFMQLRGFDEFIKTAGEDVLKELQTNDSDYFYKTLAFAIVLGHGKVWAEKFGNIIAAPPSWYSSDRMGEFSTTAFTAAVIEGMYHFHHEMNYRFAGNSVSGFSGSHSYGSHSSRSGSGFSGFSGGHSGGGFGGGGGSSW